MEFYADHLQHGASKDMINAWHEIDIGHTQSYLALWMNRIGSQGSW